MKIAVIGVKGIPANQGGIEHYCQELYPNIASQDHEVELYARSSYTNEKNFSTHYCHGVKVISLPSIPLKSFDVLINSFLAAIIATIAKPDIIHFHALGPSIFCWIPRLFSSSKIVVTCHGLDWQRAKWSKFGSYIIRVGERVAVRCADELIVVSQNLQGYFKQEYGVKAVYIPTAPAKYAEPTATSYTDSLNLKSQRYILFVGRLVPEKRPDLLLNAFKILESSDWKLVFVGDTSNTAKYKMQLLADKNDRVIFTNTLTGTPLADVVRNAGLFVLPSDLEGLPLVMLEAMREGIPVLASDIAPHRQLIGEDRGWMFKAGDVQSLVSSLQKLLSNSVDLEQKAKNAQKYVKNNCNWEKVTYQNLKLYNRLSQRLIDQKSEKNVRDRETGSKL